MGFGIRAPQRGRGSEQQAALRGPRRSQTLKRPPRRDAAGQRRPRKVEPRAARTTLRRGRAECVARSPPAVAGATLRQLSGMAPAGRNERSEHLAEILKIYFRALTCKIFLPHVRNRAIFRMNFPRDKVFDSLQKSLRKLMAFRGLTNAGDEITEKTDPVVDLGLKSGDLVAVGPDLEMEAEELNVPNEVLDWADDSSGKRRYRSIGEMTDLIFAYLEKQEGAPRE